MFAWSRNNRVICTLLIGSLSSTVFNAVRPIHNEDKIISFY